MQREEKLQRKIEALKRIYRAKGLYLTNDEANVIVHNLGDKPARAAIFCGLIVLAFVIFLIVRFVL